MTWHRDRLLGFDTETGGINVWDDRIVTIALVDVIPGQRPQLSRWLLQQDREIPAEAVAVHGITTAYANEHGMDPAQALFEATGRIALAMTRGIPVVAFNAAFDFSILDAENRRHGVETLAQRLPGGRYGPVIDCHVIDKQHSRRKGSRKLVDTCAHYGVILSADGAHDASTDALAAVRLVGKLVAAYPELGQMLPAHLHALQVKWRKQQMDSLRSYFARTGKDHDGCNTGWPLRTDAPQAVAS